MRTLRPFWLLAGGIIAFTAVSLAGKNQEQSRDALIARPSGSGVVSGVVVGTDENSAPMRRATVTLNGAGVAETVIADDEGRFAFAGLPPGRFTVTASKAAYIATAWGAKKPGGAGTPIVLSSGQSRQDLVVRLPRGAVITGQVRDQFGLPAAHQTVFPLRLRWADGRRVLVPVEADSATISYGPAATGYRSAITDDRGTYRLYGLSPGDYLVVVRYAQSVAQVARHQTDASDIARAEGLLRAPANRGAPGTTTVAASPPVPSNQRDFSGFAPVYFPGTLVSSEARTVTVLPGEERGGVDVSLHLVRTAGVSGTIVDRVGRPATNIMVQLVNADPQLGPSQSYADSRPTSGRFSLASIPPGHYRLEARSLLAQTSSASSEWAETEITIDGRDMTDIVLTLQPSAVVHGRVVFDGGSGTEKTPSAVTITLTPDGTVPGSWTRPLRATSRDNVFVVENITPGRYRVSSSVVASSATTQPTPWWLASATVSGSDVADGLFEVRPGQPIDELLITFRDRPTTLTGSVQDSGGTPASGLTVLVFSTTPSYWRWESRRIREVRLSDDGTFSFVGLPPGEYWLAALNDVDADQWFDPQFLDSALPGSVKVTLLAGKTTVQHVKIQQAAFSSFSYSQVSRGGRAFGNRHAY